MTEQEMIQLISSADSYENAVKLLEENGYPQTEKLLENISEEKFGELQEKDLESVAGGSVFFALRLILAKLKTKSGNNTHTSSSGSIHGSGGGRHG